jgi:hypothetical protein
MDSFEGRSKQKKIVYFSDICDSKLINMTIFFCGTNINSFVSICVINIKCGLGVKNICIYINSGTCKNLLEICCVTSEKIRT